MSQELNGPLRCRPFVYKGRLRLLHQVPAVGYWTRPTRVHFGSAILAHCPVDVCG